MSVQVRVHETHRALRGLTVSAGDANGLTVAHAKYYETDTSYLFKALPEGIINFTGEVNGHEFAQTLNVRNDTALLITIPAQWLAHNLRELTVQGRTQYIDGEKTVYLPNKRQKNSANTGVSLLANLSISSLNVNLLKNSVTTASGETVSFFIDYLSATDQEVSNLRPQDVLRVETFDYPSDPRFNGALHVVNFVLIKYEYGGYTKVQGFQKLTPEMGEYSANSKMVYKSMTFDLATGVSYTADSHVSTLTDALYHFDDLDVKKVEESSTKKSKNNNEYLSVRAIYQKGTTTISNTVGMQWDNNPKRLEDGSVNYFPEVYPDGTSSTTTSKKKLSPTWKGEYLFQWDHGWSLNIRPSAQFTHNVSKYSYAVDATRFINNVNENAWRVETGVYLQRAIKKQSIALSISGGCQKNSLHYTGNNLNDLNTLYAFGYVGLRGNLMFGKLYVHANVGLQLSHNVNDDVTINMASPTGYISANLPVNRQNSITMAFEQSRFTAPISAFSSQLVRNTPLDAVRGNPDLKHYRFNKLAIYYNYMPFDKFSVTFYGNWKRQNSPITAVYQPLADSPTPVMVRSYVNSGYLQTLCGGLRLSANFFDKTLSFNGGVSYNSDRERTVKNIDTNYCIFDIYAQYMLKNFTFFGFYASKRRSNAYGTIESSPQEYLVGLSWHHGAFFVQLRASNFCNNGWFQESARTLAPRYDATVVSQSSMYHRSFGISVSYSFNYGKKVKPGNEIGSTGSLQSAIVK